MSETKFTVDYFIAKFQAIPEAEWCVGYITFHNVGTTCHCALGHCGVSNMQHHNDESQKLCALFGEAGLVVTEVNDKIDPTFPEKHPKLRILAALEFIKEKRTVLTANESKN